MKTTSDFKFSPQQFSLHVPDDLISDWIDVVFRVEIPELVWQELAHGNENQGSHPEDVLVNARCHHFGDLSVLIALDVDATVDGQGVELLVLFPL